MHTARHFNTDTVELEIARSRAIADEAVALGHRRTAAMARGRAHCLSRIHRGTDTLGAAQRRLTLDLRGAHGIGKDYMLGEYGATEFLAGISEYRTDDTRTRKHRFLAALTRAWSQPRRAR